VRWARQEALPEIEQLVQNISGMMAIICTLIVLSELLKMIEKSCFHKEVKVTELVEGDWLLGPVKKNGRIIYDPKKSPGVTKKDIERIKNAGIKKLVIKEGVAFIPSFVIALAASYIDKEILFKMLVGALGFPVF